jgi:hypothetical protein
LNPTGTTYLFYWYDGRWHPVAELSPSTTSYNWTVPKSPPGLPSITPKTSVRSTSIWIGHWVDNGWECWDSSDKPFVILYDAWVLKITGKDAGGTTLWFEEETFEGYGVSLSLGMFRIKGTYSIDAKRLITGTYTLFDFEDGMTELGRGVVTGGLDRNDVKRLTLNLKTSDGEALFGMTGGRQPSEERAIPVDWVAKIKGDLSGTLDLLKIEPYRIGDEVYAYVHRFSGSGVLKDVGAVDIEGVFFITLDDAVNGFYEMGGKISETGVLSGVLKGAVGEFVINVKSDDGKKYTFTGESTTP